MTSSTTVAKKPVLEPSGFRSDADEWGCDVLYALKAISLHPEAAALAEKIGTELFEPGATRAVAAEILSANTKPFNRLTPQEQARAVILKHAVARCTEPADPAWGLYMVRLVAERRAGAIIAATLRWAAEQIEADRPLDWVLKRVNEVLALAGRGAGVAS